MRDRLGGRLERVRREWAANWRIFAEGRIGLIGVALLSLVAALALIHPLLLATVWDPQVYDPITGFTRDAMFPSPPAWAHPLGVSRFGRDVLSQLMYSVRVAFGLGILAAAISVTLGTLVGCLAAFYRGRSVDTIFMRLANFLMIFPTFTLLVALSGVAAIDLMRLAIIIGVLGGLGGITVVLKSRALSVTVKPFIDAARVAGGSDLHLILRHVIPNVLPLSFLYMMFTVTSAIFAEAALSFFGLLPQVRMSLGLMINEAYTAGYLGGPLLAQFWYLWVPPGLAITFICSAFYMIGRGLDEVVNPDFANAEIVALLDVVSLGVQYRTRRGPAHALEDVSFSLASGQVLGIVGESGCGKTTMAMALMGLLPDTATVSGSVRLDGREVSRLRPKEWQGLRGKDVAMIFQGAMNAWNPVYPVGDQIVEAILAHEPDLPLSTARERVAELYAAVGLPPERRDEFPHQYSGGMKQRAVIAMALACNPKLVIADEPTTALDVIVQDRILRELRRIQRERQQSMLYISHDVAVVAELADTVAVMYAGRIVEMGPVRDLFERPVHPYTAALLAASPSLTGPKRALRGLAGGPPSLVDPPPGCRFRPRCDHASHQCTTTPAFAEHRDGLGAACWHPLPPPGALDFTGDATGDTSPSRPSVVAGPLLHVESVRKHFPVGGHFFTRGKSFVHAVDDVSLDIFPGEAFGLVGESGSGKTTLGRIVVQLGSATTGNVAVRLNGSSTLIADLDRRTFRRGVQMIFQDPYESLNPRMTIGDIVGEPLDVLQVDSRDARPSRVAVMLERVGLTPADTFTERYPHELSGGQRQRVAIARAMVVEPKFIVADEPTSMLDVSIRAGIMDLLLDFKRDFGVGFLYITHDLAVARYLCDRIAVMYQGKVVEVGHTEDVLQRPLHPYTRALIAAVPVPDPNYRRPVPEILGRSTSAIDPGPRCRFLPRCPAASDRCRHEAHPTLSAVTADHQVACYEAAGSRQ